MGVIVISLLVFGLFISWFLAVMRGNRLRIREPLSKKAYVKDYICWEKIDKQTGAAYWTTVWWQKKIRIPKPPSKAIDVGNRGIQLAEAYKISEDEYIFIKDDGVRFRIRKDKNGRTIRELVGYTSIEGLKVIDNFRPFTQTQREVIVQQYQKAEQMRKGRWTPDKIIAMTSIMGVIMLVALLLIFWGDIAKPAIDSQHTASQMQKMNADLLDKITSLSLALGVKVDGTQYQTTQDAPDKESNPKVTDDENP